MDLDPGSTPYREDGEGAGYQVSRRLSYCLATA